MTKFVLESDSDPRVRAAAQAGMKDYHIWLLQDYKQLYADERGLSSDEWELSRLQAETSLQRAIEVDWPPLLSGLLLLSSGVGLLVGLKPQNAEQGGG